MPAINNARKLILKLLRDGRPNDAVLKAVQRRFPKAVVSLATVNWYRNQLRRQARGT